MNLTIERHPSAVFLCLPFLGLLWIERVGRGPDLGRWFEHARDRGERVVWFGRIKMIWTPRHYR